MCGFFGAFHNCIITTTNNKKVHAPENYSCQLHLAYSSKTPLSAPYDGYKAKVFWFLYRI